MEARVGTNVRAGNKLDLAAQGKRVISYEAGKALADKEGIPFFEVSAKTGENVDKFFEAVARKLAGVTTEVYATLALSRFDSACLTSTGPLQPKRRLLISILRSPAARIRARVGHATYKVSQG